MTRRKDMILLVEGCLRGEGWFLSVSPVIGWFLRHSPARVSSEYSLTFWFIYNPIIIACPALYRWASGEGFLSDVQSCCWWEMGKPERLCESGEKMVRCGWQELERKRGRRVWVCSFKILLSRAVKVCTTSLNTVYIQFFTFLLRKYKQYL